jgi:tRNA (mo5U34)-methyltransferase
MKNVYFLPTAECIRSMLVRAGFRDVEIKSTNKLSIEEQRVTALGADESLSSWLTGENLELTIEGHPAPYQTIVIGWK